MTSPAVHCLGTFFVGKCASCLRKGPGLCREGGHALFVSSYRLNCLSTWFNSSKQKKKSLLMIALVPQGSQKHQRHPLSFTGADSEQYVARHGVII